MTLSRLSRIFKEGEGVVGHAAELFALRGAVDATRLAAFDHQILALIHHGRQVVQQANEELAELAKAE